MRVFVTGATGFVGSAVAAELLAAGHEVLGLARSDASARALEAAGAEVLRGTLEEHDALRRGARTADGVVHTAFIHDFARLADSGRVDLAAIEALGAALEGTSKPLVVTSGIGLLAQGRVGAERDAADPTSPAAHRAASERATLALAARGVRSVLLRLPPSVHGEGDHGFVPELIRVARARGASAYVGAGTNRWPAVHRLDAARLYRLALEQGAAGSTFHAVHDEGVPTRELAAALGRGLGLPVASKSAAEAPAHFGWIARFFALDVPATSAATRERLGWSPREVGLLADLARGGYFGE